VLQVEARAWLRCLVSASVIYDRPLSSFAFNFNSRTYVTENVGSGRFQLHRLILKWQGSQYVTLPRSSSTCVLVLAASSTTRADHLLLSYTTSHDVILIRDDFAPL